MSNRGYPPNWPPTLENGMALLDPPSTAQRAKQGLQWYRQPVYEPRPWFPADPNIGQQPRRYVVSVLGVAANTEVFRNIQIDIPGVVYALTAASFDTAHGESAGLDSFTVRFEHNTGDRLDTADAIGSALLGTASFPALIGGVGWNFDRGGVVRVAVTPLLADLRIDIVAWMIETRGPVNYGALG